METPSVPDFYKPLSLRLCKILDNIGASQDIRELYMETSITDEIMLSWMSKKGIYIYIFGSKAEGTTTYGLRSDIDFLCCQDLPEIVQCISDIPLQFNRQYRLLIVREGNTKPGYCKLQLVEVRTPITRSRFLEQLPEGFQFDCNDRVVQRCGVQIVSSRRCMYTAHGPAITMPASFGTRGHDIVEAYRCRSWPNAASEWRDRERKSGWPSQDLIAKMKNLGFFVVKVGHPHSGERDIEWRISLSLQERLLMFNLNPTQFKCYILLKMVKKDFINKKLGVEAITSYQCKTCLFYMIESTPGDLWQPRNLLACLQTCLKCIYRWVKLSHCPNYFIPKENMFEGRMDDELRIKLENICYDLLTADYGFLLCIQCDDLAKRMVGSVFPVKATLDSGSLAVQRLGRYIEKCSTRLPSMLLPNIRNSTTTEAIRKIFSYIYDLSHAIPVTEHTSDQIRNAACTGLPYLELSLISIIIASKFELGEAETVMDLLLSSKWQELSNRSDSFSASLKQATFLYMVGQYEACQKILLPPVSNRSSLQISCCGCRKQETIPPTYLFITELKDISFDEFRTSHYAPCIRFSPFEKKLIPAALAYEMLRSLYETCQSLVDFEFQRDEVKVDGQIFQIFIVFLLRKAKGTHATGIEIKSMEHMLNTDPNLRHKETAMNLIGWCYKQEGNIGMALKYFYWSLALGKGKIDNAVFWHLLFTAYEMISSKRKQSSNKNMNTESFETKT